MRCWLTSTPRAVRLTSLTGTRSRTRWACSGGVVVWEQVWSGSREEHRQQARFPPD